MSRYERTLLGTILLDNSLFERIAKNITPEEFRAPENRRIADAMWALGKAGEPIDMVTLSAALKNIDSLEGVGGVEYLTELINEPESAQELALSKAIRMVTCHVEDAFDPKDPIARFERQIEEYKRDIAGKRWDDMVRIVSALASNNFISEMYSTLGYDEDKSIEKLWERAYKIYKYGAEDDPI
jgi:hypothetical protein